MLTKVWLATGQLVISSSCNSSSIVQQFVHRATVLLYLKLQDICETFQRCAVGDDQQAAHPHPAPVAVAVGASQRQTVAVGPSRPTGPLGPIPLALTRYLPRRPRDAIAKARCSGPRALEEHTTTRMPVRIRRRVRSLWPLHLSAPEHTSTLPP